MELDSSIMGAQQDGKKIKVPLNSRFVLFFVFLFRLWNPSLYLKSSSSKVIEFQTSFK